MWCTNDVSFIFVVEWVSWVSGERGGQGGLKIEENKSARKKWHENGPKSKYLSRPPQESGVPLSSITLLGDSEGLIEGLGNQGSGGNVLWGVVQNF